jgi:Domain of unknown function (DUF4397)
MRRIYSLSVLCLAAGAVSACLPDQVVETEKIPTAGIRFINAVPDTGAAFGLDFRFVDIVESSAQFRVSFRNGPSTSGGVTASTSVQYGNARAGQRHFRIFLDDTLQSVAQTVIKDSTLNLEDGKKYTVLLWGYARNGSTPTMRLTVFEENVPAPFDEKTQVALRVINASGTTYDVRQYPSTGTVPAGVTWTAGPLSVSNYVFVAPGQVRYNVQPSGGGTAVFSDPLALIGTAPTIDIEGLPGTTVAGSAVTMIIFPPSVTGSKAASFTSSGASFIWDRRPPRPAGT